MEPGNVVYTDTEPAESPGDSIVPDSASYQEEVPTEGPLETNLNDSESSIKKTINDGECSIKRDNFQVEEPDNTSSELDECKRTVLNPYHIFLKVIGWEKMVESPESRCSDVLLNYTYPAITMMILTATMITQIMTCYFRTQPANYRIGNKSGNPHLLITCSDHVFISDIIPDLIILSAYLYGMYIFRFGDEKLVSLMEKVFLSYAQHMTGRKRKIVCVLKLYLLLGGLWVFVDFILNGLRSYTLRLFELETFNPTLRVPPDRWYDSSTFHTTEENVLRYILMVFTWFGFIFFDLLYFAVVVTYATQSQLIQYFIQSVIEKVEANMHTSMKEAIKDIRQTYDYMDDINKNISILSSLVLFLFLNLIVFSIYNLSRFPARDTLQNDPIFYVGLIIGLCNIIQWTLLASIPIAQASRLTAQCKQLRRLGLKMGSNQLFMDKNHHHLEMDYFVQYTYVTRYNAKLACVPIYPSLVVGVIFVSGFIGSFVIAFNDYFKFARWF